MDMRFWLRAAASLVLVVCCFALPFVPQNTVPFGITTHNHRFEIIPSSLGFPLPAALRPHDVLRFDKMTRLERMPFAVGMGNIAAGTTLTIAVERHGQILRVPAVFTAMPSNLTTRLTIFSANALIWLQIALGLLLLWRGRHRAAAGVAVWCLTGAVNGISTSFPLGLPLSMALSFTGNILAQAGTLVGLLLVADGLAGGEPGNRRWRWLRPAFFVLLASYLVSLVAWKIDLYLSGARSFTAESEIIILHLGAFVLPIAMIVLAYPHAPEANRARIRWFLASMAGLVLAYIMGVLSQIISVSGFMSSILQMLFTGLALCGFTYAVLRHQLVSIRLVINRALAYGIITSVVVVVFAVLSAVLEQNTLSAGTNRLLVLLVPLLLGATLHTIKHHLDSYINKWFFRRRYQAESALRNFARTCAHIEQPSQLLKSTADELFRNSGAQGVALYLVNPADGTLRCVESRGVPAAASIDTDDLALVRLRAGDTEVDLHGAVTAFGREGFAFPLSLPKRILGVVVCGARPAEQYTADERQLFAHVASQIAAALHALELREQQQMLQDIATGSLQSLTDIQNRARALLAPHLSV